MTHNTKFWLCAAFAVGLSVIVGIILGRMIPAGGGVQNPELVLPLALGMASVVVAATWIWWRNTDDLQQQGQLISWMWGGCAGAIIAMICAIVLTGRHSEVSMGMGMLWGAQVFGMAIVWLGWRIRGRGASE